MKRLVPDDFEIPMGFQTDVMKARMLTMADAVKDHEAVIEAAGWLPGKFCPDTWFKEGAALTLLENQWDLAWHEEEWAGRKSFVYTVMTPDESRTLGCFYILPHDKNGHDAVVYIWVRKSEFDKGLDPVLESEVRTFMTAWPFKKVLYYNRG